MIYVVRSNDGRFYRRGKLVRSREAASCGHSPSGVAGILARARAAFPALQWEAVPFRDADGVKTCAVGICPHPWDCGDRCLNAGVMGRVGALGEEIDRKLSKYDEPQTFAPELEAAADAALARLACNADSALLDHIQRTGSTVELLPGDRFRIGGLHAAVSTDLRAAIRIAAGASGVPAAPSPVVPQGWKLVPIEPTTEMCLADWNVGMSDAHSDTGVSACVWAAMLAAAPAYQPEDEDGVAAAPAGPLLEQMAASMDALDEGHDPLCMAVLRGKACTCGVGGTNA